MGDTLQGNQVVLYGELKDIAPNPVVMLGIDANGLAQPIGVAASGGGIPITPPTVTASPHNLAASGSITIPAGSKGWTVTCLTGTLSIACGTTASALPAGFSDGDTNTTAADIVVTTASASTAYVRYNT